MLPAGRRPHALARRLMVAIAVLLLLLLLVMMMAVDVDVLVMMCRWTGRPLRPVHRHENRLPLLRLLRVLLLEHWRRQAAIAGRRRDGSASSAHGRAHSRQETRSGPR